MSSSANMATATKIEVTRHSLEPPCGLPSPTFSNTGKLSTGPKPSSRPHIHITALIDDDLTDDVNFDGPESHTLISCLTHLSLSSLSSQTAGPVITRFPAPPPPVPSSLLGSREEQRRIYLGPKLSDRATGGPDAGPLIERFSCLFKDREYRSLDLDASAYNISAPLLSALILFEDDVHVEYNCRTNPKGIVSL